MPNDKNKDSMENEIIKIMCEAQENPQKPLFEYANKILALFSVSKCYSDKDMVDAYNKGFNQGKYNPEFEDE